MCYICLSSAQRLDNWNSSDEHFSQVLSEGWEGSQPVLNQAVPEEPLLLSQENVTLESPSSPNFSPQRNVPPSTNSSHVASHRLNLINTQSIELSGGKDKRNDRGAPARLTIPNEVDPGSSATSTVRIFNQKNISEGQQSQQPHASSNGGNFYDDGLTYSTADAFSLSTNPNSSKTIFLDFTGASLNNTAWYDETGVENLPSYSLDNDFENFSDLEREAIIEIWKRVSADYAPWDVNITTLPPTPSALSRSGINDTVYGTTALITSDTPSNFFTGAGGVAYLGTFDATSDYYKPALTFADRLGNNTKSIAEATSHEIGHNLWLYHDGVRDGSSYYSGTNGIDWAPIMGVGYYKDRVTFGRSSDYVNGDNDENDFYWIANEGLSWWDASSEADNTAAGATLLEFTTTTNNNNDTAVYTSSIDLTDVGGDGTPDVDYYQFSADKQTRYTFTTSNALISSIGINNQVDRLDDWEGNLLSLVELYDENLNLLLSSQAISSSNSFTFTAEEDGLYYISIQGDPAPYDGSPTWGNLGGYELRIIRDNETLDNVRPTVAVSSDLTSLRAGNTATLSFSLSEASTNFTASDISVSGGSLSDFSGSGATYNAVFTPAENSTTDGVISIASDAFSDAAGNTNQDGSDSNNSLTLSVDTRINQGTAQFEIAGSASTGNRLQAQLLTNDPDGKPRRYRHVWELTDPESEWGIVKKGKQFRVKPQHEAKMLRLRTSYVDGLGYKEVVTSEPIKITQTSLELDFAVRDKRLIYLYTTSPQAKTSLNPSHFSAQTDQGPIGIKRIRQKARQGLIKIKLSDRLESKQDFFLSYEDPAGDQLTGVIQSRAGSDMNSFSERVHSISQFLEPPRPERAELQESQLTITFDETINFNPIDKNNFEANLNGRTLRPQNAEVNEIAPASITLTLNNKRLLESSNRISGSVSYRNDPSSSRGTIIQDLWGNEAESFYDFPIEIS